MSRRQTTLLIGGSNGTATLCGILGDKSNPINAGHILRVATRTEGRYLVPASKESTTKVPRRWRCDEKKHLTDVLAADFLPTRIKTHVGAPDSVFVYGDDTVTEGDEHGTSKVEGERDGDERDGDGERSWITPTALERAISGEGATDDGGVADIVVLCCPVSAHLSLLRRVARALYRLDERGALGSSPADGPPILIGTLYAAGGFDWMSRIAFAAERPKAFSGRWKRSMALFGLKAFPYLCKSLEAGKVTLHGRFPQLQVAVCPSDAPTRSHARRLLDRVLQNETTGKRLEFLGASAAEGLGGDGSSVDEEEALGDGDDALAWPSPTIRSSVMLAARARTEGAGGKGSLNAVLPPPPVAMQTRAVHNEFFPPPPGPAVEMAVTRSPSDLADPTASLAYLSCTLNSTNQILHPCILVALFRDRTNPAMSDADGTISWDASVEKTVVPRFYADGAARPEAGRLITSIAGAEMYFVMDAIERLLAPRGSEPITALHGGEPLGRRAMNFLSNSPRDLGARSGLTDSALLREWRSAYGKGGGGGETASSAEQFVAREGGNDGLIRREKPLAFMMSYGLSHNERLGKVLSPCLPSKQPSDAGTMAAMDKMATKNLLRPNTSTRFFTDDVQHGLCIYLGLAELLGFDVRRDLPKTLYVVRRLQRWMGKEFVLPEGGGGQTATGKGNNIVGDARDVSETSAPQAFGVRTMSDLRNFLALSPFGEMEQRRAEEKLLGSSIISKL